ncbi:MAG: NADH-quinone oxidoreductase subunit NuoE [Candidatus Aminicenantes bacterium]|nr:NADH-quinone oxidoreductase subunit NuoE [Candidatus Aminicenantes bacterium]
MAAEKDKVQAIIAKHRGRKNNLMAILQDIQAEFRYLPQDCLRAVSETLDIPLVDIVGVATFYRAFSLKPRGKHTCTVCQGTACHVRGAPRILDEFEARLKVKAGQTTEDKSFTLETVACLGCCAIGPVVVVDNDYHAHTTVRKVGAVLKKYRK